MSIDKFQRKKMLPVTRNPMVEIYFESAYPFKKEWNYSTNFNSFSPNHVRFYNNYLYVGSMFVRLVDTQLTVKDPSGDTFRFMEQGIPFMNIISSKDVLDNQPWLFTN